MRLIVFFIAITSSLLASLPVHAQFGRKATISGFVGTTISGKEKVNSSNNSQDIFDGLKPGIVLGGALFYNVTKLLAIGARARYLNASKTNEKVNQFTIGVDGKFNFLPSDKKISPYIVAEGNLSFAGVNQTANVNTKYPTATPGSQYITVDHVDYFYPTTSVSFVPIAGYAIGAGLDVRVSETIGAFIQCDYSSSMAKNQATIKKYFPTNTSNFSYILISAGLKFNLFKSTSLY